MTILTMKNISKSFGANKVLDSVDFFVEKGEIHALLGENGAGKSTLMNILTGVIPADTGKIIFEDKEYLNPTIQGMQDAGIAFVHQELNVINDLAVYENIFLCKELTKGILLDKKAMIEKTEELFKSLGVSIDPKAMVSTLKTAEKQLLEICRALYTNAQLFILDEPTTALSNDEIEHLFNILRDLKNKGKSFIFISHKMPEIFAISDSYTVLRNGTKIVSGKIKDTTPTEVTSAMVGQEFSNENVYEERPLGDVCLTLTNYSGNGFKDINLQIRKGEIVAFTGLAGSGASELMQTMFGVLQKEKGDFKVNNTDVSGSIANVMRHKVAMLPANRKENSVVKDMNILENSYLAEHIISYKKPIIKLKEEVSKYEKQKTDLSIKSESPFNPINSLSGGNQQKVFLARWLQTGADILLFDNPTQGVDVGAKEEIYRLILEFAKSGKTVIINTLEIPEIQKVSDRCIVFYEGKIVKEFKHSEINEKDVMLYSTNAINEGGK